MEEAGNVAATDTPHSSTTDRTDRRGMAKIDTIPTTATAAATPRMEPTADNNHATGLRPRITRTSRTNGRRPYDLAVCSTGTAIN